MRLQNFFILLVLTLITLGASLIRAQEKFSIPDTCLTGDTLSIQGDNLEESLPWKVYLMVTEVFTVAGREIVTKRFYGNMTPYTILGVQVGSIYISSNPPVVHFFVLMRCAKEKRLIAAELKRRYPDRGFSWQ